MFYNADGRIVDENLLPVRSSRKVDGKKGESISKRASAPVNEDAKAWRRIKRSAVLMTLNDRTRERGFQHFATRLYCSGKGFSKEYLKSIIDRI